MPRPRRQDDSSESPLTVRLTLTEKADYRRAVEGEGVSMSDDMRAHIDAKIKAATKPKKAAPKRKAATKPKKAAPKRKAATKPKKAAKK